MRCIAFAGRQLIFEHSGNVLACDTIAGTVSELTALPSNADAYVGSCEFHGNGRAFALAVSTTTDGGHVEVVCVDANTGKSIAAAPWQVAGTAVDAVDVSAACGAVATNHAVAVIDPYINELYLFAAPVDVRALSCWRTGVGCYIGDASGNVYSVDPQGVRFVGAGPSPLLELHALADRSCLVNGGASTAVLFVETGKCVEFKRT